MNLTVLFQLTFIFIYNIFSKKILISAKINQQHSTLQFIMPHVT